MVLWLPPLGGRTDNDGVPLLAPLVICVSAGWVALLIAAPLLPAAPAGITYALGSLICHQISDRSFHLGMAQLPVCARCLGIYAGFAGGATLSRLVRGSDPTTTRHRGLTPRVVLIVGAIPTLVTVIAEWAGLWQTSNMARALAGAPLGIAVALVVHAALATLHYGGCPPRPPRSHDPPPMLI
jgi:uncharacterized membrane protein